jgi:hypothetical protein
MLNRLRQIVASLANNPALLQLLRDDPRAFSQQLGLSGPEIQALNGAGDVAGKWAGRLAEQVRRSIAAKRFLPDHSNEGSLVTTREIAENGSSGECSVPICAVVGTVGLVAAVSTVAVVALNQADEDS